MECHAAIGFGYQKRGTPTCGAFSLRKLGIQAQLRRKRHRVAEDSSWPRECSKGVFQGSVPREGRHDPEGTGWSYTGPPRLMEAGAAWWLAPWASMSVEFSARNWVHRAMAIVEQNSCG